MSRLVIISCAVTGSGDTVGLSRFVPVTPAQIADDALAAHAAGAAVVHLHVRNPETGGPSRDIALYRDVVSRISNAVIGALKQKDVVDKYAAAGTIPLIMGPDELKTYMAAEVAKWVRLAKEAGIQPE